jgi:hypothetical protein
MQRANKKSKDLASPFAQRIGEVLQMLEPRVAQMAYT